MKKATALGFALFLILSLPGCGSNEAEPRMTADEYTSQLWEAYEAAGYEVNELDAGSQNTGTDSDIGEYEYTGHIVSDGVYVATYEQDGVLLRVQITLDFTLATGPDIELGAFAVGNLLSYADPESSDDLYASLGLDDMDEGIYEADGHAGHYKALVGPLTTQNIVLIYTLDPIPESTDNSSQ